MDHRELKLRKEPRLKIESVKCISEENILFYIQIFTIHPDVYPFTIIITN